MSEQLIAELRAVVQQIALKSQVSAMNLERSSKATDDDIGGRRPSGGVDRGDDWSLEAAEYWLKSGDYFQRKLERVLARGGEVELRALIVEAEATLKAWSRSPLDLERPASMKDPKWGIFIAYSKEDAGTLARWYGCKRQHIYATRKKWRDAA